MSVQVIDNFSYRGKKGNFERDNFDTLQAMRSYPEDGIDDGHVCFCNEDGNHYKFNHLNSVDGATGRWRLHNKSVNTLTETGEGKVLDARQGKILKDLIDAKVIEAGGVSFDTVPTKNSINPVTSNGIKEAMDEQAKSINSNMGVDDYPVFSTSEAYPKGKVVNYNGKLYKFTADHAAGAWIGTDVEGTNLVRQSTNKIDDINNKLLQKLDRPKSTDEEFNVADKNANVGFKVDKNGVNARKYNIVNGSGEVVQTIDENTLNTINALIEQLESNTNEKISIIEGELNKTLKQDDSDTELNIVDKNNNIGFSVNNNGLKSRKYNIVDENGNIVAAINSDGKSFKILDSDNYVAFEIGNEGVKARKYNVVNKDGNIVNIIGSDYEKADNDLGNTCHYQEKKGTYYLPDSIEYSGNVKAERDFNITKFKGASVKIFVSGLTAENIEEDTDTIRGSATLYFNQSINVNETLSFWIKVPSQYFTDSNNDNIKKEKSMGYFNFKFYNNSELIHTESVQQWSLFCGWYFYKCLTDNLMGKTFNRVVIEVATMLRQPNMEFWVQYFVVDQRMFPTFNYNLDNSFDDRTLQGGFVKYVMDNRIPLDLRINMSAEPQSEILSNNGQNVAKYLYDIGQVDSMPYSGDAQHKDYADAVEYLKNDTTNGRLYQMGQGNPLRDIITVGCANNHVDDSLKVAFETAGYKFIRSTAPTHKYSDCYFDKDSNIIGCGDECGFSDYTQLDAEKIQEMITNGKAAIDNCIKYGTVCCMMAHQVIPQANLSISDNGLAAVKEAVTEIMDYAIEKQNEGVLQLKTLTNLYKDCVL